MSLDGDVVKDTEHDTIADAWDVANDIGSKWFFYPIPVVVTPKKYIVSAPDALKYYERKKLTTLQRDYEKLKLYNFIP